MITILLKYDWSRTEMYFMIFLGFIIWLFVSANVNKRK